MGQGSAQKTAAVISAIHWAPFSPDNFIRAKMYKSRFKYFGQTGFIITIGLLILILDVGLLIKYIISGQDVRALIYVGPMLVLITLFLWSKILTEMNQVTVTDSIIEIKNPFTQRTRTIEKT